jgi:hypothetical protein
LEYVSRKLGSTLGLVNKRLEREKIIEINRKGGNNW